MRIILASESPQRAELLRHLLPEFEIAPADVDETPPDGADAHTVCRYLAESKARAAAAHHTDAIVIAADTICAVGDEIIGKPTGDADAVRILRRLSGREQAVVTGVCLVDTVTGRMQVESDQTLLHMRPMTGREIAGYVASGQAAGRSGAYGYIGEDDPYVDRVDGSPSNVQGLPLELLARMLAKWNITCTAGEVRAGGERND